MVRQELRQAQDWRTVIDAIRPVTQQLWQALPFNEQKRFLRHIKAYWEVHRHRIAEGIADILDAAMESGQLTSLSRSSSKLSGFGKWCRSENLRTGNPQRYRFAGQTDY
ncbi:hypothetical protein [Dendronalium sp. ChiSLP03b]|uniref:hypothetical protein n=1 Tax=Dendronalium sp. ChiSLP03b TaxID=3075381 RepID=UPI002AD57554|nr:hypothetical protein [Dendronalium sp. ChiSLP03b]MDZ8204240.1 hypothetical protein [Dendronalium sp. ChiSLP03b]